MALVLLSLRLVKGLLVSWSLPTAAGTQRDPCLHVTHVARRALPFISAVDGGAGPAEHPCSWNRTGPGLGDGEHMGRGGCDEPESRPRLPGRGRTAVQFVREDAGRGFGGFCGPFLGRTRVLTALSFLGETRSVS